MNNQIQGSSAPFKVMSYNICNPVEILKNPELHKKFSLLARMDRIAKIIEEEAPDVIGFQEVRDEIVAEKRISAIAALMRHLSPLGYRLIVEPNNPSDLSFYNVIAISKSVSHVGQNRFWASKEQSHRFNDPWGNGFGRVINEATLLLQEDRGVLESKSSENVSRELILTTFKDKIDQAQSYIDIGDCARGILPDLWDIAIQKGYRLLTFDTIHGQTRVVAYDSTRYFPEINDSDFTNECLEIRLFPVEMTQIQRIHQNDGGRIDIDIPTPQYKQDPIVYLVNNRKCPESIHQPHFATPITILNLHNGLGLGVSHPFEKKFSNIAVAERIKNYTGNRHVFVTGDYNSFPDMNGPEELAELTQRGLIELSKMPVKNQNDVALSGTFVCYSYDRMKDRIPKGEFGSQLVHIFYRSIGDASLKEHRTYALTKTGIPELDSRTVASEQELIKHGDSEIRDNFPSDHLPLVSATQLGM